MVAMSPNWVSASRIATGLPVSLCRAMARLTLITVLPIPPLAPVTVITVPRPW